MSSGMCGMAVMKSILLYNDPSCGGSQEEPAQPQSLFLKQCIIVVVSSTVSSFLLCFCSLVVLTRLVLT